MRMQPSNMGILPANIEIIPTVSNSFEMGNIEPYLLWLGGRRFGEYEGEIHTEPYTWDMLCLNM